MNLGPGDNGPNLAKAIYGPEHYAEEHLQQKLYKPRYLRQLRGGDTKQYLFAFPDGLPGGWNSISKAHFVAHSQGAQTVRYLQYLLSIDYFSYLDVMKFKRVEGIQSSIPIEYPLGGGFERLQAGRRKVKAKQDRSNYIASITTLNGVLNGSPAPYFLDLCPESFKYLQRGPGTTWLSNLYQNLQKTLIVGQNLIAPYMTMQRA